MRSGECSANRMTTINIARRAFFRGRAVQIAHHVPWAVAAFEDACRRCDECVQACEEAILIIGDGGFPTVDFRRGACTFCGACVAACRYGALDNAVSPVWSIRFVISDDCLSRRGIACRSCGESCPAAAIRFCLAIGGRAEPQLDPDSCTGCGACVAVCPTETIQVHTEAA